MSQYQAPLRDMKFHIDEVLDFPGHYAAAGPSGLTDEEVAGILGEVEVNKVRKRCSDLRNEDMIAPLESGETRVGKSGVANLVCAITDRGIATHTSMKEPDVRTRSARPDHDDPGPHGDGLLNANACLICGSLYHRTINCRGKERS